MRRVPDILTASRAAIGITIALLGFKGRSALEVVIALLIVGWTTDILDGRLARRYKSQSTWIGEREFAFDMLMVFSGLCYAVMAGFIPFSPAAIYTLVAAIAVAYYQSKTVAMSFAFPLVALPLVLAYVHAPRAAWVFLIWILLALLSDRHRFKGIVLEFIDGAKTLMTDR